MDYNNKKDRTLNRCIPKRKLQIKISPYFPNSIRPDQVLFVPIASSIACPIKNDVFMGYFAQDILENMDIDKDE